MMNVMTSSRPYLIRALNQWIQDNTMTSYIVVDANQDNVIVPVEYVDAGKIILNISPFAVQDLFIDNEYIRFSARFSGKPMNIQVPVNAVMAIYAKENGQGMVFAEEVSQRRSEKQTESKDKTGERPSLKLVK